MGLFLSTGGSPFTITELGYTIPASTTDWDITTQFTAEEIRGALSLTSAIQAGTITWRLTAGGTAQTAANYDPDYAEVEELKTGAGTSVNDTLVTPFSTPAFSSLGSVQATANAIKTLTRTSNTQQIFTGTVAGQRVNLPNATTLINSHIFEFWNFSSQTMDIRDAGGNLLTTLRANSRTTAILINNSTSNGLWGLTYTLDNGNVFGTQIYSVIDESETSNSGTSWVNKLTLTTPSNLPLGDYMVQFQFIWRSSSANREADFRFQLDGTNIVAWQPSTGRVQDRQLLSGFKRIDAISGTHSITFDFKYANSSATIYVRQARMFIWRIA